MLKQLTEALELFPLHKAELEFAAEIALGGMDRLPAEVLREQSGAAEFSLTLSQDGYDKVRVSGQLQVNVALLCQRCLQPFSYFIDKSFTLWLVASEASGSKLEDDADYSVLSAGKVCILELLEDELILALPGFAKHEEKDCAAVFSVADEPQKDEGAASETKNPFAVLKNFHKSS